MAKRAHAKTVEVNSSHVAHMSHPKETARLIEDAAALVQNQVRDEIAGSGAILGVERREE